MQFDLIKQDGAAHRGRLTLAHGTVETPVFMPVGTYGTVKAMTPDALAGIGAEICLGNTFHLWLRPGLDVIQAHRGLHDFMNWRKPILKPHFSAASTSCWTCVPPRIGTGTCLRRRQ